jgi:hypothetical protein
MKTRGTATSLLGLLVVALLACKQGDSSGNAGAKCASDGDCKNGLLWEGEVCVPEKVARAARSAANAAAAPPKPSAPAPSAVASAAEPKHETTISGFDGAGMKSKVPTIKEWNAVGEITVRHSTPLGCETKMVRDCGKSAAFPWQSRQAVHPACEQPQTPDAWTKLVTSAGST